MQYTEWKNDFQKVQNSGNQALNSLYLAKEKLSVVKHQKLSGLFEKMPGTKKRKYFWLKATALFLCNVRRDMESFQMVLQNAEFCPEMQADIHCFLSFADFFFYEVPEDHLKESEIEDVRLQVEDAIERVEYILLQMELFRKKLG